MHPNPAFRQTPQDHAIQLAQDKGFGTLAVTGTEGPLLAHVPFLLAPDAGSADLHLVRSNPILRCLPAQAVIAVLGPDGYVSPDWYEVDDQVPTWNYVAVHLRGVLEPLPQDHMRDMLDRQSADFERRLHPKPPWTVDRMTPDARDRMMRQIVPCRLRILQIDSTWKLNQNKPDDVRLRAADAMADHSPLLAALMRDAPGADPKP